MPRKSKQQSQLQDARETKKQKQMQDDATPGPSSAVVEEEIIPTFSEYDYSEDVDYDPAADRAA